MYFYIWNIILLKATFVYRGPVWRNSNKLISGGSDGLVSIVCSVG